MDNTSNHQQDESSWIPTIEERRQDPSLQVCLGCGCWFSAKWESCTCWTKSDHQRRKITVDEFRSMLDRLVMLRDDDDDDDDESDEKRFNGHAPMFEPTPEEVDSVLNDVFTAMATSSIVAAAGYQDDQLATSTIDDQHDFQPPCCYACGSEVSSDSGVCGVCGADIDANGDLRIDDDDDDDPDPLAWSKEAGYVHKIACPHCGKSDFYTEDEKKRYETHRFEIACPNCGRLHGG